MAGYTPNLGSLGIEPRVGPPYLVLPLPTAGLTWTYTASMPPRLVPTSAATYNGSYSDPHWSMYPSELLRYKPNQRNRGIIRSGSSYHFGTVGLCCGFTVRVHLRSLGTRSCVLSQSVSCDRGVQCCLPLWLGLYCQGRLTISLQSGSGHGFTLQPTLWHTHDRYHLV